MNKINIRPECLQPGENWTRPTGDEIREVLRLADFTGGEAAKALCLGKEGGRTVRRWVSEETNISYGNWALLCDFAGIERIWKKVVTPKE